MIWNLTWKQRMTDREHCHGYQKNPNQNSKSGSQAIPNHTNSWSHSDLEFHSDSVIASLLIRELLFLKLCRRLQ